MEGFSVAAGAGRGIGAGGSSSPWCLFGFARRLRFGCGRGALVASFRRVRLQSRAACFIVLGAVACSVLLCLRRFGARRVIPAVAGWFGPC